MLCNLLKKSQSLSGPCPGAMAFTAISPVVQFSSLAFYSFSWLQHLLYFLKFLTPVNSPSSTYLRQKSYRGFCGKEKLRIKFQNCALAKSSSLECSPLLWRRQGEFQEDDFSSTSCLENPRDGGAWWAAVYGVVQSWTQLKRLSSSSSNCAL